MKKFKYVSHTFCLNLSFLESRPFEKGFLTGDLFVK